MGLLLAKFWRIARRCPKEWLAFLLFPLADRGSGWTATLTIVGVVLSIQVGGLTDIENSIIEWVFWAKAFGVAVVLWSIFSMIRAPFAVIASDRAKGKWEGNHFLYHEPQLIFSQIVSAKSGLTQAFSARLPDVESGAFVNLSLEVVGYNQQKPLSVVFQFATGIPVPGYEIIVPDQPNQILLAAKPGGQSGRRLDWKRRLVVYVRLAPDQSAKPVRIYCTDFFVGNESSFE